jgi:hypothetical protein
MNSAFYKLLIIVKVFSQVLFLFGLLAWLDGVVIQFTHPEWLPLPVSHLLLGVRTDTFTILMFILSAVGFFVWRVIDELIKGDKKTSKD